MGVLARPAGVRPSMWCGCPMPRSKSKELRAGPRTPEEARLFLAEALETFDVDVDGDAAHLLTSEIASNAVRHGKEPIDVSVSVEDAGLRVSVFDRGGGFDPDGSSSPKASARKLKVGEASNSFTTCRLSGASSATTTAPRFGSACRFLRPRVLALLLCHLLHVLYRVGRRRVVRLGRSDDLAPRDVPIVSVLVLWNPAPAVRAHRSSQYSTVSASHFPAVKSEQTDGPNHGEEAEVLLVWHLPPASAGLSWIGRGYFLPGWLGKRLPIGRSMSRTGDLPIQPWTKANGSPDLVRPGSLG